MTKEEIIRECYSLLESNEDTKKIVLVDTEQTSKTTIGAPIPKPH